jgi:phospholipid/cholesterol/gamma-HCH transport system substrate-binding protein
MPRTRSLAWSQLKVGIAGVAALLLLIVIVLAIGGGTGFWWQRYTLKARFADVQGLKPGALVRLSGKQVGTVETVEFAGQEVEVVLEIIEDVRPLITTTSVASIESLGLLGEPMLAITTPPGGTALPDGGFLKASTSGGMIDDLASSAGSSLESIQQLIADVRAGRGTLGRLVTDEALYNDLQAFVAAAGDVVDTVNRGQGTLGGLVKDPAAYESLKASLENLRTITARIDSGQGALGRFLNDDAMGKSMAGAVANAETITGRLAKGEGTAGRLLTDQQLYDRLNAVAGRVDAVVSGLESGQGTAGRLLRDQVLYENMNRAVTELRDLLADIRRDPKQYLRVNVSIF